MNYDFAVPAETSRNLLAALNASEQAQLVRRVFDALSDPHDVEYIFKHALVQDSAYESVTRHDRKRLHAQVGKTLEFLFSSQLDDIAALLAFHFEKAEEWDNALRYLSRAAEHAHRAGALHVEADLLARAIIIAVRRQSDAQVIDLRIQRARALSMVTRWAEARAELDQVLQAVPVTDSERRASVLLDLAEVTQWLWDNPQSARFAQEAVEIAERLGRADLQASALTLLALAQVSNGHTRQGIESYDRLFKQTTELTMPLVRGMEFSGTALYWVGDLPKAIERNRQALHHGRELQDAATIMRAMPNLAVSLASHGEYRAAFDVFGEARAYGQEHEIGAWLARSISMESGVHLWLFDYAGAEHLASEAREVARQAHFAPAGVSAAIDLMLNYLQRGDIALARSYGQEVARAIPGTYGSHRWLWETRYTYAQGELALLQGQVELARQTATGALEQSHSTGRIKYQALALLTRAAAALLAGEREAARADLNSAYQLARQLDDPAILLRVVEQRRALDGTDAQIIETRKLVQRISSALPEGRLRERFEGVTSEWL